MKSFDQCVFIGLGKVKGYLQFSIYYLGTYLEDFEKAINVYRPQHFFSLCVY